MRKEKCRECGYTIRSVNHTKGTHHEFGLHGNTKVLNATTNKIEEKSRR